MTVDEVGSAAQPVASVAGSRGAVVAARRRSSPVLARVAVVVTSPSRVGLLLGTSSTGADRVGFYLVGALVARDRFRRRQPWAVQIAPDDERPLQRRPQAAEGDELEELKRR